MLPSSIQTAVVDILAFSFDCIRSRFSLIISQSHHHSSWWWNCSIPPPNVFPFSFFFFSIFLFVFYSNARTHITNRPVVIMLTGILYTYPSSRWIKTFCVHILKGRRETKEGSQPDCAVGWSMIWSIHLFVHDCNVSDRPAIVEQRDVRWSKRTATAKAVQRERDHNNNKK